MRITKLLLFAVLFGMTSCMENYYVPSVSAYHNSIRSLTSQMADQGYEYTGYETSYEKLMQRISDKGYRASTYRFADSLGNTMQYSVVFREKKDGREERVYGVDFCECKVSNPKDYERLCGIVESVGQLFPETNNYKSVPKEELEEADDLLKSQLASQGFGITGRSAMRSYSESMNGWQTDTHHYVDGLGNTVDVAVRYQKHDDGVYNTELCGCETSNPKDNEKICGEAGLVKQITQLPEDHQAQRLTGFGSIMAITGFILVLNLPLLLLLGLL